jgi:hypothetical protein
MRVAGESHLCLPGIVELLLELRDPCDIMLRALRVRSGDLARYCKPYLVAFRCNKTESFFTELQSHSSLFACVDRALRVVNANQPHRTEEGS